MFKMTYIHDGFSLKRLLIEEVKENQILNYGVNGVNMQALNFSTVANGRIKLLVTI